MEALNSHDLDAAEEVVDVESSRGTIDLTKTGDGSELFPLVVRAAFGAAHRKRRSPAP